MLYIYVLIESVQNTHCRVTDLCVDVVQAVRARDYLTYWTIWWLLDRSCSSVWCEQSVLELGGVLNNGAGCSVDSAVVDVLQRGYWCPDNPPRSLYHSLHALADHCSGASIPHSEAAGQDALNDAAAEVAEDLWLTCQFSSAFSGSTAAVVLSWPAGWCLVSRWGHHWCKRPGIWSCSPSLPQAHGWSAVDAFFPPVSCP